MSSINIVHVAVAVIKNQHGQIFIAKRPKNSHQGGLWEFPGGKIENNETVLDALKRELFEEIGITIIQATPLIKIHHNYNDKSVLLDVWCIDKFTGKAFGKEDQETCWVNTDELSLYDFPAANLAIIKAAKLPDQYMITGAFKDEKELLTRIQSAIEKGIKLIQFRAHNFNENIYFNYAKNIYSICKKQDVTLLLNTSAESYKKHQANEFSYGLHLNSKEMKLFPSAISKVDLLISTSIHNKEELLLAEKNNVDFAVLSPVNKTLSHPDSIPIGWDKFKQLSEKANIPIYALGGMKEDDLITAKNNGAQGIAAIGEFWDS